MHLALGGRGKETRWPVPMELRENKARPAGRGARRLGRALMTHHCHPAAPGSLPSLSCTKQLPARN